MHSLSPPVGLRTFAARVGNPLAQTPHTHQHSFSGADGWAKVFDDPERDRWQKPHEVIMALKLASNSVVADIGAGTGYFSARLAHMTPGGRVYAVDLEPDMVKYLGERAKRDGLKNLVAVQAKPDSPALPDKVDRILLVDTYHHISERSYLLQAPARCPQAGRTSRNHRLHRRFACRATEERSDFRAEGRRGDDPRRLRASRPACIPSLPVLPGIRTQTVMPACTDGISLPGSRSSREYSRTNVIDAQSASAYDFSPAIPPAMVKVQR